MRGSAATSHVIPRAQQEPKRADHGEYVRRQFDVEIVRFGIVGGAEYQQYDGWNQVAVDVDGLIVYQRQSPQTGFAQILYLLDVEISTVDVMSVCMAWD